MAKQVQFRRGTTTEISTFVGVEGEVVVDTTKDVLVVMDGSTSGGFPVAARANADGTIGLIKKDGTIAGSINSSGLFNNTLTSTNIDQALTAAQGKVLKDLADTKQASATAFGVGQTWQNLTSSRSSGVTYTNSTGKPIYVWVSINDTNGSGFSVMINGVTVISSNWDIPPNGYYPFNFIVPAGHTYQATWAGGNSQLVSWSELR